MASASSTMSLMRLLNEIVSNDQKQQDGFLKIAPIAFWTQLFAKHFLHVNNPNHDDLLFYVRRFDNPALESEVEVYRRQSNKTPGLGDPKYDWTETVYLNLILQQLDYTLTCGICVKDDEAKKEPIFRKTISQQVYASPSNHDMDQKGHGAKMTYPNIFFTIDSFDEVWNDLVLNEGEMCCVEIVATDTSKSINCVIFLGSVSYSALMKVYERRAPSVNKWTQVMSLGLLKTANPVEFVRMKGPNGKGYAEMAIQRYDAAVMTPSVRASNQCTCSDVNPASSGASCPVHTIHPSQSDSALIKSSSSNDRTSKIHHVHSTQAMSSKQSKPGETSSTAQGNSNEAKWKHAETLKTHLTYVTLPWHKIILDLLQTFEKPSSAKRPVLHRTPISV